MDEMLMSFNFAVIFYRSQLGSSRYLIFELYEGNHDGPGGVAREKAIWMSARPHTQLREHIILSHHHHISYQKVSSSDHPYSAITV
jgi:hypothetical protein